MQEMELKNLRNKHAYLRKKFEGEREKLLQLSMKKKEIKVQEAQLRERETEIIETAKDKHDIDFQDAEQIAERGMQDSYREQYEQLQRKVDILEGAIQSQNRKFKIRAKAQGTRLEAFRDRQQELEHQIAVQEAGIEEKRRALQIVVDQKEARRQILKKQRELGSEAGASRTREVATRDAIGATKPERTSSPALTRSAKKRPKKSRRRGTSTSSEGSSEPGSGSDETSSEESSSEEERRRRRKKKKQAAKQKRQEKRERRRAQQQAEAPPQPLPEDGRPAAQEECKQAPASLMQTPPILQSPAGGQRQQEARGASGGQGRDSPTQREAPGRSQADNGRDASPSEPTSQMMQRNQVPDYESDNTGNGAPDDRREDIFEQDQRPDEEQKESTADRNADGAHTPISALAQMRPSQVVIEAPTKDEIEMTDQEGEEIQPLGGRDGRHAPEVMLEIRECSRDSKPERTDGAPHSRPGSLSPFEEYKRELKSPGKDAGNANKSGQE